jgi:tetratricopeptide (TPR) repeat protein
MANKLEFRTAAGGSAGQGDGLLHQAMVALDGERPQEAERIAGEVLKTDPHHARALYVLGRALLMRDRAGEAIAPLEAAARGRHDSEIDTMLAIAFRLAGRNEDALRRLKLATKRRPPYPLAFKELGYLLVSLERYDEAIEALRHGLEVAPMMPQLSIQLGYALLSRRNCADAIVAFGRALELLPNSPDALFGMAKAHRDIGEDGPASEYFRRYLTNTPGDHSAWLHLGHCLLGLGELETGYECFRTAARGNPKHYGDALTSLAAAGRGRFWLKRSDAERFMRGKG